MNNISILKSFNTDSLPNLDIAVLGALELFIEAELPQIEIPYSRPLVVGSGNAEATGRIIFENKDAVFASESDFESKLQNISSIDGVVVVSASGSKHAPIIESVASKYNKHSTLITSTSNSPAEEKLDMKHDYDEFIFPKNREPYTYNTSTYMGMILGSTGEDSKKIYEFINNNLDWLKEYNFSEFDKYFLVLPNRFSGIKRMLQVKFIELFGREVARDVETLEYMKHAVTVVPSNELFIYFGVEESYRQWGDGTHNINVPIPVEADYAAMMAIGYYTIGQIQKAHRPYFKENIVEYCKKASSNFGKEINPIVE